MSLINATDAELKAELQRREAIRLAEADAKRVAYNELVRTHVDSLLEFRLDHQDQDCRDNNTWNYRHCTRCALLELKARGAYTDGTFEVEVYFYPAPSDR